MYVKNWQILSYCRSHIHYAAVLYIFFLEISYLCISVFVTLTHCYVRNVTEEIDQPLLRCCHISWNEWLKSFEASLLESSKSKLEGFIHSWIFPSEELFYLYTAKFFKDVEDTCLQNKADHVCYSLQVNKINIRKYAIVFVFLLQCLYQSGLK